jgi:threonine dehydrogenase-like Zn-dependent dehydrogenase
LLANILFKPGRIELREMKLSKPSYGEILVKIKAALTCGTDLKAFIRGHPLIPMPGVFGHEFSGIVTEVGKGVRRFKEGDAVMAVHTAPCLTCSFCRRRLFNLCEKIMHTKVLGAFAEYIILPSHVVRQNVFHKPEALSFEEAAFLEPLSCVVHSVENLRVTKGDSVLIIGAGPIGLLHLLLLKRKGAKVAVADIKNERLKVAKRLGADFVIKNGINKSPSPQSPPLKGGNPSEYPAVLPMGWVIPPSPSYLKRGFIPPLGCESYRLKVRGGRVGLYDSPHEGEKKSELLFPLIGKKNPAIPSPLAGKKNPVVPSPLEGEGKGEGYMYVKKFTDSLGFDYVFECTGMPDVWEASVNYVRKGGTVILFGGCKSGTTVTYDTGRIHYDEITIKGVFHYTPSDVRKAYEILCEGGLGVSRLISGRYSLGHVQRAFNKLATGTGIKFAIIP